MSSTHHAFFDAPYFHLRDLSRDADGYWPDTYPYFQTAITLTLHSLGPNEWIEHSRRR